MTFMRNVLYGLTLAAGLAVLGATSAPLLAHHSFAAEFDDKKPITLVGTITKMAWTNPHSWLYIDVKDEKGNIVPWNIEFGSPNALYRRGWRRTDLPLGAVVTIQGYLAKDGSRTVNATDVKLPDGKTLFAGSSGTGAPPSAAPAAPPKP
jgi:hypothetical protein